MANRAFYYVDGIPTKGMWIDLDDINDTDEVLQHLAEEKLIPVDEDGEQNYGGDLLVADIEGPLVECFYSSRCDSLDLYGFVEARDYCKGDEDKEEAVAEFIENVAGSGPFSSDDFESAYCGEYDSEEEYAKQLVDDLGYLDQIPENLRFYFDYEKFARDLFINDCYFSNGHVFNRNY